MKFLISLSIQEREDPASAAVSSAGWVRLARIAPFFMETSSYPSPKRRKIHYYF
jgi:hypothetical protein